MELLQLANESLTALLGWLFSCWPVLLVAPFVLLDWRSAWDSWRSAWDYVFAAEWGRIWPLPSALLPAFIPIARDWDQKAPSGPEGYRLGMLLVTLAALQLYGLQRNNRDRLTTEDRFTNLTARFADLFDEITKGRKEAEASSQEARDDFDALVGLFRGFSEKQSALGDSEPGVSPSREQQAIDLLKNDSRLRYDQDDEHFLEILRDEYISWWAGFLADNPSIQPVLLGMLVTRWPLFTGLIGVSYNFGVDWTQDKKTFPIPEEDIRKWLDYWMKHLDLDDGLTALLDDEIYPYLVNAIESSIRYGLQKSISDLVAGPQLLPD
jgi:hypothetical protein